MTNTLKSEDTVSASAETKLEWGAVTPAYEADRDRVIEALNDVLATEMVCMLRYKSHYYNAKGVRAASIADEFLEHARQEEEHADRVASRIAQIGGKPEFDPGKILQRSHIVFRPVNTLGEMVVENLKAERVAIQRYTELIRWLGNSDPTTRRMLEDILAQEEEHADDMVSLLEGQENLQ